MRHLLPVCAIAFTIACATVPTLPPTPGETASGFGYVPLDGLAIREWADGLTCLLPDGTAYTSRKQRPLLEVLPDISVRFAVASSDANGTLSFGPAKITARDGTYRAVLDYVNVESVPVGFYLKKLVVDEAGNSTYQPLIQATKPHERIARYVARIRPFMKTAADTALHQRILDEGFEEITIPVYVGIGMRLSADVRARKAGIALTSLGAIGAAADADALSGTLTVQTLGVTGKSIATSLPLPSKLDQTTVENGILALGSSRALVYNADTARGDVTTTARVVGLYTPVGSNPSLINAIYSELSRNPTMFMRSCIPKTR